MEKKFHINDKGKVYACRAKSGNCRYGDNKSHFATREEGNAEVAKRAAEENSTFRKLTKKAKLPEVITPDDLGSKTYSEEEKVHVKLFELLKTIEDDGSHWRDRRLHFGYPESGQFGSGVTLDPRDGYTRRRDLQPEGWDKALKTVEAFGVKDKSIPDLLKEGYKVDLVRGSFREEYEGRFNGTFATSEDWESYLVAEVVVTTPENEKFTAPVAAEANAQDIAQRVVERDYPDYKTANSPRYIAQVADSMSWHHPDNY